MTIHPFDKKTVDRFWAQVNKNGPVPAHRPELGPCWIWEGSICKGYGRYHTANKSFKAHRISALLSGFIRDPNVRAASGAVGDQLILHKCDNRLCVRPDHFEVGSQKQNIGHSLSQGRFYQCKTSGESHVNSKLSTASVRMIRALRGKFPQSAIAQAFGIEQSTVSGIQTGLRWKHVP